MGLAAIWTAADTGEPLPKLVVTGVGVLAGCVASLAGWSSYLLARCDTQNRKAAEAQERLEMAFRGTHDGLWDWKVDTGEVVFSDRFKALMGFRPDQLQDEFDEWSSRLHPEDKVAVLDAIERHLSEQMLYDIEYRLLTKSGDYRWFHAKGDSTRDAYGRPVRMSGSLSDVTARKENEVRLRALVADLEEVNGDVAALTQSASKELLNPVINLIGFTRELSHAFEVIKPAVKAGRDCLSPEEQTKVDVAFDVEIPEAVHFLEDATGRVERLANVIGELSMLARRELEIESVDMNAIVRDCLHERRAPIHRYGIEVICRDLPKARGDAMSMTQVVREVLDHAISHRNARKPSRIEISGVPLDGSVIYQVRDNGVGATALSTSQAFELAGSRTPSEKGRGIGMPLVRTLVRRNGGTMEVTSAPGKGASVSFSIPRCQSSEVNRN